MTFDIQSYLKEQKEFFESSVREKWQGQASKGPELLHEAMEYSFFASGKRVRPILVFAAAETLGLSREDVLPIAESLEMIHVFSLIHDDLPAMDDDDLRRGKPTNHKVYGEALAILAGDALLSESFLPLLELNTEKFGYESVRAVIRKLAEATGPLGMIGGQVLDMQSEGRDISLDDLQALHRKKTGALIEASVLAPAILSSQNEHTIGNLRLYAESIGLAFQIADDILDIEGEDIGKDIGSDERRGKSTYPKLLGLDGAKQKRQEVFSQALESLTGFGEKAEPLKELARYIVERKK